MQYAFGFDLPPTTPATLLNAEAGCLLRSGIRFQVSCRDDGRGRLPLDATETPMGAVVGRIAEADTDLLFPPVRTAEVLVIASQVALEVARELANETEIRRVPNGAMGHDASSAGAASLLLPGE